MKKRVQMVLSLALGTFLVWLLFRNTDWETVYASIRAVKGRWIVLAQVCAWSAHFARVQRWSYVVRATHPTNFGSLFSAMQIGTLVNFTVPARVGELVRAYVLKRRTKLPLSRCVSTVALDRVNDVAGLLVVFLIALLAFPADRDIELAPGLFNNTEPIVVSSALVLPATVSLTVFLCVSLLILILLYTNQDLVLRFFDICIGPMSKRLAERIHQLFLDFAAGMHVFRSARELAKATVFSLLVWAVDLLGLAALLIAFSVTFPWFAPFLMLAVLAAFISVPVTPGVVGQYHIPIVACLLMAVPGMPPAEAKAVAIVAHLLTLIPIAALGLFCLYRERLGFLALARRSIESAET